MDRDDIKPNSDKFDLYADEILREIMRENEEYINNKQKEKKDINGYIMKDPRLYENNYPSKARKRRAEAIRRKMIEDHRRMDKAIYEKSKI